MLDAELRPRILDFGLSSGDPSRGHFRGTPRYLADAVTATDPDTILWLSTWETSDRVVDGTFYEFGTRAADRLLLERMEESYRTLTASGASIVMVANTPRAAESEALVRDPEQERDFLHLNALYQQFADSHPDSVRVLDLPAIVCPGG